MTAVDPRPTVVVAPAFTSSTRWEYYASPWAPGGRFLLETDANAEGRYAVFTTAGTSRRQQVTPDSVAATSPAWIPE